MIFHSGLCRKSCFCAEERLFKPDWCFPLKSCDRHLWVSPVPGWRCRSGILTASKEREQFLHGCFWTTHDTMVQAGLGLGTAPYSCVTPCGWDAVSNWPVNPKICTHRMGSSQQPTDISQFGLALAHQSWGMEDRLFISFSPLELQKLPSPKERYLI